MYCDEKEKKYLILYFNWKGERANYRLSPLRGSLFQYLIIYIINNVI
jgi:hypothetical protein